MGGGVIFFLMAERVGGCQNILYTVGGILKKISPLKKCPLQPPPPPLQYPQGMQAKSINARCRKRRRKIKY